MIKGYHRLCGLEGEQPSSLLERWKSFLHTRGQQSPCVHGTSVSWLEDGSPGTLTIHLQDLLCRSHNRKTTLGSSHTQDSVLPLHTRQGKHSRQSPWEPCERRLGRGGGRPRT